MVLPRTQKVFEVRGIEVEKLTKNRDNRSQMLVFDCWVVKMVPIESLAHLATP